MVKHTQTIRRKQPTNCLNVFDHFEGLALRGLSFMIVTLFGGPIFCCKLLPVLELHSKSTFGQI